MKKIGKYTIVTAISQNMWDEYLLFHMSLMRFNSYELRVIGLDLNANQKEFIRKQIRTTLVEITDEMKEEWATIDHDWKKWYKPAYFKYAIAGLDTVLWLDTDIIVSGGVEELFSKAQEQFFVMQDYFAPQYCPNKPGLYTHFGLEQPSDHRVVNSGVWGCEFPRDNYIIDKWIQNVKDAHNHKIVYDNVTLHDQGTLLLTLHQLDLMKSVLNIKKWNFPARRLFYDNTRDIIDMVTEDNPEGLLIHYAGLPKLPHLQTVNHEKSIFYFNSRCGAFSTAKYFVTGSEHLLPNMVAMMRKNVRSGGWFQFSELPIYADYMEARKEGRDVLLDTTQTHFFNRSECPFACTVSPYFGPLFSEFIRHWPNGRYIVVLGDPVETVIHKLRSFKINPIYLGETPGTYQCLYGNAVRSNPTLDYLNRNRVNFNSTNIIDACLDEIEWHLEHGLTFVDSLPNGRVIWANKVSQALNSLTEKVDNKIFDRGWVTPVEPKLTAEVEEWISSVTAEARQRISDRFFGLLTRHKVKLTLIP